LDGKNFKKELNLETFGNVRNEKKIVFLRSGASLTKQIFEKKDSKNM
jgi:hypothetical protein